MRFATVVLPENVNPHIRNTVGMLGTVRGLNHSRAADLITFLVGSGRGDTPGPLRLRTSAFFARGVGDPAQDGPSGGDAKSLQRLRRLIPDRLPSRIRSQSWQRPEVILRIGIPEATMDDVERLPWLGGHQFPLLKYVDLLIGILERQRQLIGNNDVVR